MTLGIGKDFLNNRQTVKEMHGKLDFIKIRNSVYQKIAQRE